MKRNQTLTLTKIGICILSSVFKLLSFGKVCNHFFRHLPTFLVALALLFKKIALFQLFSVVEKKKQQFVGQVRGVNQMLGYSLTMVCVCVGLWGKSLQKIPRKWSPCKKKKKTKKKMLVSFDFFCISGLRSVAFVFVKRAQRMEPTRIR